MKNSIGSVVSKLSKITKKTPVDWDAFDSALLGLENINVYDEGLEETLLSEYIMDGDFYQRGELLPEVIRHFLSCGYDVSANDGQNGLLALDALCWSSYDQHILTAAKVLMNAGAPIMCHSGGNDEPQDLIRSIDWKAAGAWMADKDFAFANILEAYYKMAKANLDGKDYASIDTYFSCIGETLTSVSAVKNSLECKGEIFLYTEPLVMWFGDMPLIPDCYTDFVVNPVYAADRQPDLTDISSAFDEIIGAKLMNLQYIGSTICALEFDNGYKMIIASRSIGGRKRIGSFAITAPEEVPAIETLDIDFICGIDGVSFADTVTNYHEEALALFCADRSYAIYLIPGAGDKYQLKVCSCPRELLREYTRRYPLGRPAVITCFSEQNGIRAIRFDCPEGCLYLNTKEYYEIEVHLYDPMASDPSLDRGGKHIDFQKGAIAPPGETTFRNKLIKACLDKGMSASAMGEIVAPMYGKSNEEKEQIAKEILASMGSELFSG